MKIIVPFITALLTGVVVFFAMRNFSECRQTHDTDAQLVVARDAVAKRFQTASRELIERLSAFAQGVASDQLFSLRLLAEENRSAPEVVSKAGQFMAPMGFSLLEIVDSAAIILSSGHFPASAGNRASGKAELLSEVPQLVWDNILGQNVLTLQAKRKFLIADSIVYYAMGGIIVDDRFLSDLSPGAGVTVLLKQGGAVSGMKGIRTLSDVKDNRVIINDKEFPACRIDLPSTGDGEPPVMLVVVTTIANAR